jgi:hypothetical protein
MNALGSNVTPFNNGWFGRLQGPTKTLVQITLQGKLQIALENVRQPKQQANTQT